MTNYQRGLNQASTFILRAMSHCQDDQVAPLVKALNFIDREIEKQEIVPHYGLGRMGDGRRVFHGKQD